MIFRQHIPNFVSGCEPEQHEVNDKKELLALGCVKSWSEATNNIPFYRYSKSKHGEQYLLMAEYKGEEHLWYVVGYLSEDIDLPEFIIEEQ